RPLRTELSAASDDPGKPRVGKKATAMEWRDEETHSEESLMLVFSRLKPYCLDLLDLARNPKKDASFLAEMADFLRRAPAAALQPSLDYTLFPFLLLLDAAVQCREEKKADSAGGFGNGGAPLGGHAISDSAAEGMLMCLEELLKKCHLGSVNQAAELEALRGHRGSANLRKEAFLTLRVLVAKVGTADALAFFLPGVVSRFAKALCVSKNMISGAAGRSVAIEQAICGLIEFLIIVLHDKANLHSLEMSVNDTGSLSPMENKSTQSVLEALRSLPLNGHVQSANMIGDSFNQAINDDHKQKIVDHGKRTLFVHRSKEWIDETSSNVDKLMSAAFPHLCIHSAVRVRKALVDGIQGLLLNCRCTLQRSKLMLLECLCVLVCDDADVVSMVAQESLESLFVLGEKFITKNEISNIFTSLIKALPRVVLGSDETIAFSHAQKLLSLVYYAGPDLFVNYLQSPVNLSCFLECLGLCFSHNSRFPGSMNNLILSKPLSTGYLLSIAELKAGNILSSARNLTKDATFPVVSKISILQDEDLQSPSEYVNSVLEFPHMPPWFGIAGSQKLYLTLAGVLRLVGLSIISGPKSNMFLSVLVDNLLDQFRQLISELRMKEYGKEGWKTWYFHHGSGQLLRKTSSAVCMLNEIIYGLSEQSVNTYSTFFKKSREETLQEKKLAFDDDKSTTFKCQGSAWNMREGKDDWDATILSIGSILHEYLSPEVWDIPLDQNAPMLEHEIELDLPLHFFLDTIMLQQEMYFHLLSDLRWNSEIRVASDAVLRVLSVSSGHATVGQLVVANADYIIDSLCYQLRHLDVNPHVPDVLAAILSYVGTARDILPLLEEPMRAVSSELEVLGRHQHPNLTIPFLKAVGEIAKASQTEASSLPNQAEMFRAHVSSKILMIQKWINENHVDNSSLSVCTESQALEELLFKFNEMKRYRRIVGSLVGSCLKAASPLVSSQKESACLVSLDIIEDVSVSLAKLEEAYKHEKQTKAAIWEAVQLLSLNDLKDGMETADEEADENRVLPAMNIIWPYLILCLKNKVSVVVIRKCLNMLHKAVQIGGGDFFVRRFKNDGHTIWKLLTSSPFRRKPTLSNEKRILLPYRSNSITSEEPMAEVSTQKIQAAVLDMITKICSDERTSSALQMVRKKVSGIVVGIACSSMAGLKDASLRALSGLACIDSDLTWLLLADVYYSLNRRDVILPPCRDLAGISELLPAASSKKEYLFVNYAGEDLGLDIDPSSVEVVFRKMESEVLL
ncbi:TELO2 interacting protein 1, partial [Musa troglodytarum]